MAGGWTASTYRTVMLNARNKQPNSNTVSRSPTDGSSCSSNPRNRWTYSAVPTSTESGPVKSDNDEAEKEEEEEAEAEHEAAYNGDREEDDGDDEL